MKRGNIFLLISIIIVIAIAFYISSSLTGKITLEDSSINNNVNLEPIQYPTTIEGCLAKYREWMGISPEACKSELFGACYGWERLPGTLGPTDYGRCSRYNDYDITVPCIHYVDRSLTNQQIDNIIRNAPADIGTCCHSGGNPPIPDAYGDFNACCGERVKLAGLLGDERFISAVQQRPFDTDPDGDGVQNFDCCEGYGKYNVDKKDCCPTPEGNELRDKSTNGCPACGCYNPRDAPDCKSCKPNSIATELIKNPQICEAGCRISTVCSSHSSNHNSGCGVDIKCSKNNYNDLGNNIDGFLGYPACRPGQGSWTDQSPCCKKHKDGDETGNIVDSDDGKNHIHCQTC